MTIFPGSRQDWCRACLVTLSALILAIVAFNLLVHAGNQGAGFIRLWMAAVSLLLVSAPFLFRIKRRWGWFAVLVAELSAIQLSFIVGSALPVLFGLPFLMAGLLAFGPSSRADSWKRVVRAFLVVVFGILIPVGVFVMSASVAPDSKQSCTHGWIQCFYIGKLALVPLVLWASAAFYAAEVSRVNDPTRVWIVMGSFTGAVVSTVLCLFGFVVGADGPYDFEYPEILIPLSVPVYTAVWYVVLTIRLVKSARFTFVSYVFTLLGATPFWALSLIWSRKIYSSLPETRPGCFVATAASGGHPSIVGSLEEVVHRGERRRANRQMITLWDFESHWRTRRPTSHYLFRLAYNAVGPIAARCITSPLVADFAFLAIKPIEILAKTILVGNRRRAGGERERFG